METPPNLPPSPPAPAGGCKRPREEDTLAPSSSDASTPLDLLRRHLHPSTRRRLEGRHRPPPAASYDADPPPPLASSPPPSQAEADRTDERGTTPLSSSLESSTPLCSIGADAMVSVLSYLDPIEVHTVVSYPLSREWRCTYSAPQDLWRALCLSEPFRARPPSDEDGCYRALYASFALSSRYLDGIRDWGGPRPPEADATAGGSILSEPRRDAREGRGREADPTGYEAYDDDDDDDENDEERAARRQVDGSMEESSLIQTSSDAEHMTHGKCKRTLERSKCGSSEVTHRLLGWSSSAPTSRPHRSPRAPCSCAIYSVVSWMEYFSQAEGMQIKCLEVLPFLPRNGDVRASALRTGPVAADAVLRAMLRFPLSADLHSSAYHALVRLARPAAGGAGPRGGTAEEPAVSAPPSAVFDPSSPLGRRGAVILTDSMRRFASDPALQAMGCWSMVNVAIVPEQRSALLRAGAVTIASDAMARHPANVEVQFRALFALINLVVPEEAPMPPRPASEVAACSALLPPPERHLTDESVRNVASLVARAMRTFHASGIVLNRACLVLHNLSLDVGCHDAMLRTPGLYEMVEWCVGTYRHDPVLRHSAGETLRRLGATLKPGRDARGLASRRV